MTYTIRARDFNSQIYYLRGWDKKIPVWITEGQYNSGRAIQEYARIDEVKERIELIRKGEKKWKSLVIIEIH